MSRNSLNLNAQHWPLSHITCVGSVNSHGVRTYPPVPRSCHSSTRPRTHGPRATITPWAVDLDMLGSQSHTTAHPCSPVPGRHNIIPTRNCRRPSGTASSPTRITPLQDPLPPPQQPKAPIGSAACSAPRDRELERAPWLAGLARANYLYPYEYGVPVILASSLCCRRLQYPQYHRPPIQGLGSSRVDAAAHHVVSYRYMYYDVGYCAPALENIPSRPLS